MTLTRFCWRERTERINWRMLRNLQITDVVRRGDATLLEPYALHLTFAKLPVIPSSLTPSRHDAIFHEDGGSTESQHNVWFLVRVFQLAMEYLLFLRARDSAVVDSLREELVTVERECELVAERAKKWKERSKSGSRQVDKLHQVLQSIAKLLQIEGATPSAVSTIESLLRELTPIDASSRRGNQVLHPRHVEEARVCALCGKMFSSSEFLEKHLVRRHPGFEDREIVRHSAKPRRDASKANEERTDNQAEMHATTAHGMKDMLRAVEQTLAEHQASLRHVAQEEAEKIHSLYEQLHVETQLAEEMRVNRLAAEQQLATSRRKLEATQQEKEGVMEQIQELHEQLQFLTMRKRIESQSGLVPSPTGSDPSLQLEVKRLEETISMLKDALAVSRSELTKLQDSHSSVLKAKQATEEALHEASNHAQRLEASLRGVQEAVPLMKRDSGTQTENASSSGASTQTEAALEPASAVPVISAPAVKQVDSIAIQTEQEPPRVSVIDTMIQTDVVASEQLQQQPPTLKPSTPVPQPPAPAQLQRPEPDDSDAVFRVHCAAIADSISRRALRSAHTASSTPPPATTYEEKLQDHAFASLSRRKYLRSRFLHDERAVKDRIAAQMKTLDRTAQRYGVEPSTTQLATASVDIVQRALHAHLEVLPSEVLERMVAVEGVVNGFIQSQWMPQEQSRQRALEQLTATLEAKSQRNQGLVRQAMVTFVTDTKQRVEIGGLPTAVPSENDQSQQLRVGETSSSHQASVGTQRTEERVDREPPTSEVAEEQRATAAAVEDRVDCAAVPLEATPAATQPAQSAPPSPQSVQEVRKQTNATVRAVKVVTVSPKSSPPKGAPPSIEVVMPPPSSIEPVAAERVELPLPVVEQVEEASPDSALQQPLLRQQAPSSFSARRAESQLGIVIPSRYDRETVRAEYLVSDSVETEAKSVADDSASASEYSNLLSSRDSRWSSSLGRAGSGGVHSVAASSELSFNASFPSLHSEEVSESGAAESPSSPQQSVEQLSPQVREGDVPRAVVKPDTQHGDERNGLEGLRGIVPIREEASSDSEGSAHHEAPPATASRGSPPRNDVMAFDDSDIEEVMLA